MAHAFLIEEVSSQIGAKSLLELSTDSCRKHIDSIWDLGETPLHLAIPLCRSVRMPEQLGAIETNSPLLRGNLGPLWLKFIKREVLGLKKLLASSTHKDGSPWTEKDIETSGTYKMYQSVIRKSKRKEKEAEELLRQAYTKEQQNMLQKETRILEKPLRVSKRSDPLTRYNGLSRGTADGNMTFTGGSRTRTNTGQGVLRKIRRQTRENNLTRAGGVLATPSHLLQQQARFLPQGVDTRDFSQGIQGIGITKRPGVPLSRRELVPTKDTAPMSSLPASARARPLSAIAKAPATTSPSGQNKRPLPMAAVPPSAVESRDDAAQSKATDSTAPQSMEPARPKVYKRPAATYLLSSRNKRR